jgi:D-sedoheptulose 7-phosphate isomerase
MDNLILKTINEHKKAIENFENNSISIVKGITQMIIGCLKRSGTVYLCGNGGSAADCQHIAGEFVGRFRAERNPLPAVAFSTDTSVITCIGNDYSFKDIFVRQAEALVKKEDILWTFSTSGSSGNVIKAAEKAKEKNAKVIAFTGKADSELEKISDICLCAVNQYTSTSQEVHILAYHIICDLIDTEFAGGK